MCGVEFLALLWLRGVYGGSCRNVSASRCHKKSWISFGFTLSIGKAAETFLLRSFNHLSIHQWLCSAIHASQPPTSPIGFLSLKLPPPPCAVLAGTRSTLHSRLQILHFTLHTPHSTLFSFYLSLHAPHFVPRSQSTVHWYGSRGGM